MAVPRAVWKGSLTLGLVGIPVRLYTATEEKNVSFNQVHAADGGRIEMHRVCQADGAEVPYAEIIKGYDIGHGSLVLLSADELAEVPTVTTKAIVVEEFVPAEQVDPIYYDRAYYVVPDGDLAAKPYLLVLRALEKADRVGIAKVSLREKEHLAALRVRDGMILLNLMLWPDEVREPDFPFLAKRVDLRPQEREMAANLVDTMAGDFTPADFTDEYREAVAALVEAKMAGHPVTAVPAGKSTKSADLLAALTVSVEQAREARREPAAKTARPAKTAPAKASKKTAAKKTAAKAGTRTARPSATGRKSAPAKRTRRS